MALKGERDIQFIDAYIILMLFFGITETTTIFFFPGFGEEVFKIINFYFVSVIAMMALVTYRKKIIQELSLFGVSVNFIVFFIPFYLFLITLFYGFQILIPAANRFVPELIISVSENYLAFILFPAIIGWGNDNPEAMKKIIMIRDYSFGYRSVSRDRFKRLIPSIILITILHVGTYSQQVTTFEDFYFALGVAFIMFSVFAWFKEAFGFGSSEAAHASWNLALIGFRGAVM